MPATGLGPARALRLGWREARPVVQAIFQLRFITGAAFAARGSSPHLGGLALGAAAWLCATWSIYLLNGVRDQTEDRRNGLSRPLSTGELSMPAAQSMVKSLAVCGLCAGAIVSWRVAALVAAMLVLGWVYSAGPRPQKRHVAGFAIVVTAGGLATYLAGWYAAGAGGVPGRQFWVLAVAMSLWMGLAGNTKDLSHVLGDRAAGRRTLPLLLGDAAARWAIAGLTVTLGSAAVAMAAGQAHTLLPAAAMLLTGACAVAATLVTAGPGGSSGARRRPYRMFMSTQYAVHAMTLAVMLLVPVLPHVL
jgi:4-hydroxybenzoate polyprenyltransferase/chlorophyll synthase